MSSMRIMRFNIPDTFTPSFLHDEILKIHNHNSDLDYGRARISVFRTSSGNYKPESNDISYIIKASEINNSYYEFLNKDLKVDLYKDYLIDSQLINRIKSNNKSINVLASIYASENDLDNCILLNKDRMISEFINGNLFLIKDNLIRTPNLSSGCLDGVMRKTIIKILHENNFNVIESDLKPFEIISANEMFMTNVVQGIQSIKYYRKKIFSNNVTSKLLSLLNTSIN
tara:strand:- start:470 stop:1153 length:684 start_codon:yes stop_codon:yes gene_type:complete